MKNLAQTLIRVWCITLSIGLSFAPMADKKNELGAQGIILCYIASGILVIAYGVNTDRK